MVKVVKCKHLASVISFCVDSGYTAKITSTGEGSSNSAWCSNKKRQKEHSTWQSKLSILFSCINFKLMHFANLFQCPTASQMLFWHSHGHMLKIYSSSIFVNFDSTYVSVIPKNCISSPNRQAPRSWNST